MPFGFAPSPGSAATAVTVSRQVAMTSGLKSVHPCGGGTEVRSPPDGPPGRLGLCSPGSSGRGPACGVSRGAELHCAAFGCSVNVAQPAATTAAALSATVSHNLP